jgi:ribosomal protein S18 acetylase RimI-like enzyme
MKHPISGTTEMTSITEVFSPPQVASVAQLAREIWPEHYVSIIGQRQVDYMLDKFQSEQVINGQLAEGYRYFVISRQRQMAGYLAIAPVAGEAAILISKIYVRKSERGHGLGKALLARAEELCRQKGFDTIRLTVNRHNQVSIAWYQRMGFSIAGEVVQDIGGGFVMDDFLMKKTIPGNGVQ